MYDEVTLFNGDFAAVKKGNKWGAIDRDNNKVIDFKYQEMKTFIGKNTIVRKGKKFIKETSCIFFQIQPNLQAILQFGVIGCILPFYLIEMPSPF